MNIEKFWELVEECKDADHPEIVLAESLDLLSAEEVLMFAYYLDQMHDYAYRNDIWCAAYLLNGGCGDDGFHYFRYGLISKGRRIYEGALKNPDHLQILWDERPIENEAFGSAAREVYEKKTGIDFFEAIERLPENCRSKGFDLYIDGALYVHPDIEGWDFEDEEENRKRLPGLSALDYESQS